MFIRGPTHTQTQAPARVWIYIWYIYIFARYFVRYEIYYAYVKPGALCCVRGIAVALQLDAAAAVVATAYRAYAYL